MYGSSYFDKAGLISVVAQQKSAIFIKKWGALILRAEIIPLNLIRIMPAEGSESINKIRPYIIPHS
jgi:hypothetical protein